MMKKFTILRFGSLIFTCFHWKSFISTIDFELFIYTLGFLCDFSYCVPSHHLAMNGRKVVFEFTLLSLSKLTKITLFLNFYVHKYRILVRTFIFKFAAGIFGNLSVVCYHLTSIGLSFFCFGKWQLQLYSPAFNMISLKIMGEFVQYMV